MKPKLNVGFECKELNKECIKRIEKLKPTALQIYLGDKISTTLKTKPTWTTKEKKNIKDVLRKYNTKLFIHGSLRVNISNPLDGKHKKRYLWAVDNVIHDMNYSTSINGQGVVIHLGYAKSKYYDLTNEQAIKNNIKSIQYILKNTNTRSKLLIETPAQSGSKIGANLEDFSKVFNKIKNKRLGVCVDTQHIFTSGYDIRTIEGVNNYFNKFDKLIGIKNIKLIHLNDSKVEFHAMADRHESIGQGFIFKNNFEPLKRIIEIATKYKIPMILETTPKYNLRNLKIIKSQLGGNSIQNKKKIQKIFQELYEIYDKTGNGFRARAYKKNIKLLENDRYDELSKKTLNKIKEIQKTGKLKILEKLKKNKDLKDIIKLQKILGVGPQTAKKLVKNNIRTLSQFKKNHKMTQLQKLGVKYYSVLNDKISRNEIMKFKKSLEKVFNNKIKIYLAGSFRTGKIEMKDIDLIIISKKLKFSDIKEKLEKKGILIDYYESSPTELLSIMKHGDKLVHVDLRFTDERSLPFYLLFFGSGVDFSRDIRMFAKKKGYKLNQYGLTDLKTGKVHYFKTEEDIFKFLGAKYTKPEERRGFYEL